MISESIHHILQGKNNLVLVITNRTIDSVITFWGVVMSGNCYVAMDDKTPVQRFIEIVNEINPQLIIYINEKQRDIYCTNVKCFLAKTTAENFVSEKFDIVDVGEKCKNLGVIGSDPLYLVFTSGSTGIPKAIVKSHQSLLSFVDSFVKEFNLDKKEKQTLGNQAAFDFDVSAKDIYVSAYLGATLCLIPSKCFLMPMQLASFLSNNHITILIWAASAVKFVKQFDCFKNTIPCDLETVFFSGESMSGECVNYWRTKMPQVIMVNLYAPSEVTGNCLYHVVKDEKYDGILPLDRTIPNAEVLLIGEDGNEIEDGEEGEIYIRGAFLAQGYLNNEEQTALRFVQNPLHTRYRDIVYRTGDYVYKLGERLFFAGRADNQIKHMGHRIELEEIESNIIKVTKSDDICVLYDSETEKIVLLTNNKELNYEQVVRELKSIVPKYMIPHELIYVEQIPQNKRGKIDRKAVNAIYKERVKCEKKL